MPTRGCHKLYLWQPFLPCQSRNYLVEYVIVGKVYANATISVENLFKNKRITIMKKKLLVLALGLLMILAVS